MTFLNLYNFARRKGLLIRSAISTLYMYTFLKAYGVKIGRSCKFWKRTIISGYPGSEIIIGNNCVFRSDFTSNLIGVNHPCIISMHSNTAKLVIGDNCGFSGVSIGVMDEVLIGKNVQVGANSLITDHDWHSIDPKDRDNITKIKRRKVVLEDNVWIGASSIVLKGVTIGENTIVGSGSVVTRDLPSNSICGGNPCKVIRPLGGSFSTKSNN